MFNYFLATRAKARNSPSQLIVTVQTFLQSNRNRVGFSRSNQHKILDARDGDDVQHVVEQLKADGYYLLQDEPVDLGLFVPAQSPE
jgi:hypothetical protein